MIASIAPSPISNERWLKVRVMLAAEFIVKWRAADPVLTPTGPGLSLDPELTEQDERRLRHPAPPSGGGRGGQLPGHPPVRNIARTCNVRYSGLTNRKYSHSASPLDFTKVYRSSCAYTFGCCWRLRKVLQSLSRMGLMRLAPTAPPLQNILHLETWGGMANRRKGQLMPAREEAAMKEIEATLASNPHLFERVNDKGESDPNGTHWQARTHHYVMTEDVPKRTAKCSCLGASHLPNCFAGITANRHGAGVVPLDRPDRIFVQTLRPELCNITCSSSCLGLQAVLIFVLHRCARRRALDMRRNGDEHANRESYHSHLFSPDPFVAPPFGRVSLRNGAF
jgi:hypothetical protein